MKKIGICLLLVFLLLLVISFPVFAQSGADPAAPPPVPEAVLLLISAGAGGLCVKIVNFFKEKLGWTKPTDKVKNTWFTFGICAIFSVLLLLITNSFVPLSGPDALVTGATLAFSVATLLYKSFQPAITPPE